MGYLSNLLPRILVLTVSALILIGCSAVDRLIHPAAKLSPPEEPVIEEVQKEESSPTPPPEPMTMVPATVAPSPPPIPPSPEGVKVAPVPILRVTDVVWASVNLREGPGMRYKIVGNVKKGTSVAILEDDGQWLHIRLEDRKEVWIFKAATTVPPKPPPPTDPSKQKAMSKPKPM